MLNNDNFLKIDYTFYTFPDKKYQSKDNVTTKFNLNLK